MRWLSLFMQSRAVVRSTALLGVTSLTLLIILAYWLPLYLEVDGMGRILPTEKAEVTNLRDEIAVRKVLIKNNAAIKRIEGKLRTKADQEAIVRRLASLAHRADVVVHEHSFSGSEANAGVMTVSQTLAISGKYAAVRAFMALLNTDMPGLTVISRFTASSKSPGALSVHMDMQSYSMVTE